jgi:hypothetical protein
MHIWLRGPLGAFVLFVLSVFAYLLALGDVLDTYDAYWKFSVPLTGVYAVLLWIFAAPRVLRAVLPPVEGEAPSALVDNIAKVIFTFLFLLATLIAVALIWDIMRLIRDNWHYVLVSVGLVVVLVVWTWAADSLSTRRKNRASALAGKHAHDPAHTAAHHPHAKHDDPIVR